MSHVGVDFSTKAFISLNHLKDKPPVAVVSTDITFIHDLSIRYIADNQQLIDHC